MGNRKVGIGRQFKGRAEKIQQALKGKAVLIASSFLLEINAIALRTVARLSIFANLCKL